MLSCICCLGIDVYGARTDPHWKFVWNENMLKKVYAELQSDWILVIVHGFIGQSSIFLLAVNVYLSMRNFFP